MDQGSHAATSASTHSHMSLDVTSREELREHLKTFAPVPLFKLDPSVRNAFYTRWKLVRRDAWQGRDEGDKRGKRTTMFSIGV